MEGRVAGKSSTCGFVRGGVEHVNDVKEEEGMCGWLA